MTSAGNAGERMPNLLVAIAILVLAGLGLANHQLWGDHEPYIAGIVGDMNRSGDWIVPTLNGHPYLEKPPLFYWLAAATTRLAGDAPWSLRLPSALLGVFVIGCVAAGARRLSGERAARWAALLVATMPLFVIVQHEAVVDMALAAGVTLALVASVLALETDSWIDVAWIGAGAAYLAKGPVGPLMVFVPVVAWGLAQRDADWVRRWFRLRRGMAVAAATTLGWTGLLWWRGGWPFIEDALIRNSVGRFTASERLVPMTARVGEHVQPFYAYLASAPFHVGPAFLIACAALVAALRSRGSDRRRDWRLFIAFALASDLMLLSLSAEKRGIYLLPLLPVLQWLAADWLDRALQRVPARRVLAGTAALVPLTTLAAAGAARWSAQVDWPVALIAGASGLAGAALFVRLRRTSAPLAVEGLLAGWALFLVVLLAGIAPAIDRQLDPQLAPYRLAEKLATSGVRVYAAGLVEGQVGHLTRSLGRDVTELRDARAVREALAANAPAAVVAGKGFYETNLEQTGLTLIPPPHEPGNRAPALVTNDAGQLAAIASASRSIPARRASGTS